MSTIRASFKMLAFALICLLVAPLQSLILLFHKGRGAYPIPHLWHRGVCAIFGIRAKRVGPPVTDRQVLYLSNHISYLDIPLIASVLCYTSFVAKSEVSGWPLFGYLSKLQQTVFIQRSRTAIESQSDSLDSMLEAGKSLVLFPEGTSTDGRTVLPFKTSLFALPLQEKFKDLTLQPITLHILTVDGQTPEPQDIRDIYAWHLAMTLPLGPHLWRFAKSRGATIQITFHEPLRASDFTDRKILAKTCHDAVAGGLEHSPSPLSSSQHAA